MKNTLACPKCESRKLWRIEQCSVGGFPQPTYVEEWVGKVGKDLRREKVQTGSKGSLGLWACAHCGYSELWVDDPDELQLDETNGVHLIDTTPQQGGYR